MSWNKIRKQKQKRARPSPSPEPYSEFALPDSWTSTATQATPFFLEAHEADIFQSHNGVHLALEIPDSESPTSGEKGSALLRWSHNQERARDVWVDRYDARLLLSSLPRQDSENDSLVDPGSVSSPPSPSGWSDLPSDSEDTFFFTASETSDFRRNKRRRLLDAAQSVRLKSLRERDGVDSEEVGKENDAVWGDDDEEPNEAQGELMRRTARHVVTSPDPVVLEMRILANHGNDGRFAFLRGRWKHRWQRMKALAKAEAEVENAAANAPSVGLNLADYGDSEEEQSDEDSGDADLRPRAEMKGPSPPAIDPEEEARAARRARAREWSARRQADKAMLKTEGKGSAKSSET